MSQLALFVEAPAVVAPEMPCTFGNTTDVATRHHCSACTAHVEEMCGEVARQVATGEMCWCGALSDAEHTDRVALANPHPVEHASLRRRKR